MKCFSYLSCLVRVTPIGAVATQVDGGSNTQCMGAPTQAKQALYSTRTMHGSHLLRSIIVATSIFLLSSPGAYARHDVQHTQTNDEWEPVRGKAPLLDNTVLIPSLLPAIMANRDALGLSEEQVVRLNRWRKENYADMVSLMNEVIEKRIQFQIESLSPEVSESHLITFQEDIQRLERDLLKIRLRCRAVVMETFTREQWESFEFLVADDPKLGSLISQRDGISVAHGH